MHAYMPNVQIRDVTQEIHEALVRRAEVAGQSLQQYLAARLAAIVATPTIDALIARIERLPKGRV
jgi:antitoxin FitA